MLVSFVASTLSRCSLSAGDSVVVALSGGADSVALLCVLQELGLRVEAAHCNFSLRGAASESDERFVRALCQERGVPLHYRRFDTQAVAKAQGISIEMAARTLRYDWFATFDCPIATGHHLEDNAETLLLHLCRGTGIAGLAGMRYRNGNIVRPLLDSSRAEIEAYLAEKGQLYCTDATNADTAFRRNFVRHELLPAMATLNPDILRTLHATALRMRETEAVFREGLAALRAAFCQSLPDGFLIDLSRLRTSPFAATLLHEWLAPLGFVATQQWLTAKEGTLARGENHFATRVGEWLEVRTAPQLCWELDTLEMKRLLRSELLEIPKGKEYACLDADKIVGSLSLRAPQTGDRFTPLGLKGSKLVSDFLTDKHYSRIDKLNTRLLCDAKGILWVVGERIDQRVAITPTTQHVLLLKDPSTISEQ